MLLDENCIALVRLDVKSHHSEIRTVKVSKGSVSSSLPKDHVVGMNIKEVRSEPGNQSINLYKAVPSLPLLPGEYCLICNRVLYFNFGIDPKAKS